MAAAAVQLGSSVITSIFNGMALRAKQAANENQALQQIVQGFDQGIAQAVQLVNSGAISTDQARQELASMWAWYWQAMTPRIQPNRNGCSSGSNCPGDARSYRTSNGVPAGYCAGTIGATCCLGCGPIRLSLADLDDALAAGGGTAQIAKVWGDKYGLQTREAYTVTFNPPTNSVDSVLNQLTTLLPNGGQQQVLSATTSTGAVIPTALSGSISQNLVNPQNSNLILVGGAAFLALLAVLVIRR